MLKLCNYLQTWETNQTADTDLKKKRKKKYRSEIRKYKKRMSKHITDLKTVLSCIHQIPKKTSDYNANDHDVSLYLKKVNIQLLISISSQLMNVMNAAS